MRESLNSNTLFNTIAMVRQDANAVVLVVEGDDDLYVLKQHRSDQMYVLLGVGGRSGVLAAAELADQRSLNGVRFLIDADYDRFFMTSISYPNNIVLSHHHDLFMDMIAVDFAIIDRVIDTHSRSLPRRNGSTINAAEVRDQAFSLAAKIAPARIVNERKDLGFNLKEFPFGKLPLEPTFSDIATLIVKRTNTQLTIGEVALEIEGEAENLTVEDRYLVGDHDFFAALARILNMLGVKGTSPDHLANSFISALTCQILGEADWYATISTWSESYGCTGFACPCRARL